MSAQTPPAPDPADPCPELSDAELLELATAHIAKAMLDGLRMAGMADVEIALFLLTQDAENMIAEAQFAITGRIVIAPIFIRGRIAEIVAADHAATKDQALATALAGIDCGRAH